MPWIGHVALDARSHGYAGPWVEQRRQKGAAQGTINHGLQIVRRILNFAAAEWVDEEGLTWLRRRQRSSFCRTGNGVSLTR